MVARAIRIAVVVALATLATSCMSFNEVQCSDGHLCPPGSRCDDVNGGCILASQIQACAGIAEGANCQIDGADGSCINGACVAWRCGDNRLNPGEACDHTPSGPDFGGMDCTDFGFRNADGLQCTEDCRINKDNCTGGCGDKVRDQTELCDGPDIPAGTTCQTLGFYDAPGLQCSAFCTFDISKCTGFCGDGQTNGPEQCDGGPAAGESCLDYSFDAGRLGCTLCAPGFEGCTSFGWSRVTSPTTQRIRGIWGASSTDFYAVGIGGTVLHSDGSHVAAVTPSVTGADLYAIWGSAATNIVAVGSGGTIVRYDGAWSSTTSGSATLLGVWGSAANDIYAVGTGGTILHYTNAWSPVTGTGVGANDMRAVWGIGSDVFAVGASGTVAHYNGAGWTTTAIAGAPELFSVWGTSATNVFASGNDAAGIAAVYHYTGSTWTSVSSSGLASTRYGAVFGSAADDAFAVGNGLLHHDGTAWTTLAPPAEVVSGTKLWAGWVSPTGDVWTGGDGGYLAHWGGASWTTAPIAATSVWFRSVSAWTPSDAFAVGFTTTPANAGAIARYNGASWTVTPTASSTDQLYSVWAADQSFAAAVGENSLAGILYQFNGSSWANIPQGDAKNCGALPSVGLRGVWGSGTSNVLAVGGVAPGVLRRSNGSCWSAPTAQPSATGQLIGLFGLNASNVFATAINSVVHKFDGASWTTLPAMPAPAPAGMVNTWASGTSDMFSVGDAIMHFDGSKWTRMTANGQALGAVSGTGPRNVFASGDGGRLLHYDGISWTPIKVPVPPAPQDTFLRGLAATARSLIVVGDYGFVQRLSFSLRPREVNCRDGWDDDGDGMPDCADSDCQTTDYCKRGGACTTIEDIDCGATITGTTLGRTPGRDYYTCDPNAETGPEAIYRVVPPANGTATATLSAFAPAELDLVVVGSMAATDGCDPDAACRGASSQDSTATEAVTFSTTASRPAFIIVEGRNAASGPFSLQVTCQ